MLPGDFPPWPTVYYHFRRFCLSGLWHRPFAILRIDRNRRLAKDYERKVWTSEAFIEVVMICLLVKRPAKGV